MSFPEFHLALPPWVVEKLADPTCVFATVEERMRVVIELSALNVEFGTGGPFGAAVFDRQQNTLVAPGVNLVLVTHASIAHAEMVALLLAQQCLGTHDLSSITSRSFELVTSTEPCAMCLGALPWSGIQSLVCGARGEAAREIGFDEGTKPSEWIAALEQRGIAVMRDVLQTAARAVLAEYRRRGGIIYNPRLNGPDH